VAPLIVTGIIKGGIMIFSRNARSAVGLAAIVVGVAGACLASSAAVAGVQLNSNGGIACKAANGNGAKLFNFGNLYAQNTSTTPQFLSCFVPEFNPQSNRSADQIEVAMINTTGVTAHFVCVIQSGYPEFAGTVNTSVYEFDVAPNDDDEVVSTSFSAPAIPARATRWSPYSVSCSVPAGGRIGLISAIFPESFAP